MLTADWVMYPTIGSMAYDRQSSSLAKHHRNMANLILRSLIYENISSTLIYFTIYNISDMISYMVLEW